LGVPEIHGSSHVSSRRVAAPDLFEELGEAQELQKPEEQLELQPVFSLKLISVVFFRCFISSMDV